MIERLPQHKQLGPYRAPWAKRLHLARPGLEALRINPDLRREEILDGLRLSSKGKPRDFLTKENKKLSKSKGRGYLAWGLTLAPEMESGIQTCPLATYCGRTCLSGTGQNQGPIAQLARIRRTLYWWLFPDEFLYDLVGEFHGLRKEAHKERLAPAMRLNVTSDVQWERAPALKAVTDILFYDYTKLEWSARHPLPANWHLLYSLAESQGSLDNAQQWMGNGANCSVVVAPVLEPGLEKTLRKFEAELDKLTLRGGRTRNLKAWTDLKAARSELVKPGQHDAASKAAAQAVVARGKLWGDYGVIDGDADDARFLDEGGSWVVLYSKGPATYDTRGFVVRVHPDGTPVQTEAQRRAAEVPWKTLNAAKAGFRALLSPDVRMALMEQEELEEQDPLPSGHAARVPPARSLRVQPGVLPFPRVSSFRGAPPPAPGCITLPAPFWVDPWGRRIR